MSKHATSPRPLFDPKSKTDRLTFLSRCQIVEESSDSNFDELTELAAQLCEAPVAWISFIDGQREWIKSCVGFKAEELPVIEKVYDEGLFVTSDATRDERLAKHPLVDGVPHIRSWAAVPLTTRNGCTIGVFAVAAPEARPWTAPHEKALRTLSRQVILDLELRCRSADPDQATEGPWESSDKFKHLMAAANLAIIMTDAGSGEILEVSRKAEELFEMSSEELIGLPQEKLHPQEEREKYRRLFREHGETGRRLVREGTICNASGRQIPVEINATLIESDGRRIILAFFVDITRRKKREKALRESEERFQAFTDNQPATAWMKDSEGRYVYVNKTLETVYSASRDTVLGKTDLDLLPEETARTLQENDRKVLASGEAYNTIEKIPDAQGEIRSWQIWKFPFRDADGRAFVGGLGFDVTAREQAEDAQRATEERYRSLVEGARDGIFAVSKEGVLTSANRGAERITGWSRDEWIGKSFLPLLHPDDVPIATEFMGRVLAGETLPPFDLRVRAKDGSHIPMEITVTPQWLGETVTGILGIARDVRERRHLEEQLRQMQKLDSIGRLAAGIAHDFNNILTVQQGYLSLLLLADLPDKAKDLVEQVDLAVERAANLTRQLVMFSRKQVIQPQPLNLHDVISQLSQMLDRILGEDVILQLRCEGSLPSVQADPGMMEQILMNLSANARDAMPNGGRLTITTESVQFDETSIHKNPEARTGLFIRLTVADTGSGVPPAILEHLFEPFFTTKEMGKGAGLGLATVHGIVKQHQGWIETESRESEGTVFRIYLPAGQTSGADAPGKKLANVRGGSETILVVEDEPALREMVRLVLEKYGYKVITAPSGAQARRIWKDIADQVDLLLTDMVMPEGVSGRQLAEGLLQDKPSLKVIFTSGYSAELAADLTPEKFAQGEVSFLQKPYPPPVLAQTVRAALDRNNNRTR